MKLSQYILSIVIIASYSFSLRAQEPNKLDSFYDKMIKKASQLEENPSPWESLGGSALLRIIAEERYEIPISIGGSFATVAITIWLAHESEILKKYGIILDNGINDELSQEISRATKTLRAICLEKLAPALRTLKKDNLAVYNDVLKTLDEDTIKAVRTVVPESGHTMQQALKELEKEAAYIFEDLWPRMDAEALRLDLPRLRPSSTLEMVQKIFPDDAVEYIRSNDVFTELSRLEDVSLANRQADFLKAKGNWTKKLGKGTTIIFIAALSLVVYTGITHAYEANLRAKEIAKQYKSAPVVDQYLELEKASSLSTNSRYKQFLRLWKKTYAETDDLKNPIFFEEGDSRYEAYSILLAQFGDECRTEVAASGQAVSQIITKENGDFIVTDTETFLNCFLKNAVEVAKRAPKANEFGLSFIDSVELVSDLKKTALKISLGEAK